MESCELCEKHVRGVRGGCCYWGKKKEKDKGVIGKSKGHGSNEEKFGVWKCSKQQKELQERSTGR